MTPAEFIDNWKKVTLNERSACQSHFNDLCELLGEDKPTKADPTGEFFTFEKGVTKDGGGQGWADVWKKDCFGWEYKGKHKDLVEALRQLQRYREALLDPPLLIVCDMDRFEVHTNFNNSIKVTHAFDLDGLADPKNLDILRKAFRDPQALDPKLTQAEVTEKVAAKLTEVADHLRHNLGPTEKADLEAANQRIAHFLMKCIFCMFAEDADLLPKNLFTNLLRAHNQKRDSDERKRLERALGKLFEAMTKKNGQYGNDAIRWFNGSLFDDDATMPLGASEIRILIEAAEQDWSNVDPSIFGTLFERLLIVAKRSQTGAHYTSRQDIETLLNPVMLDPLKREWEEVKLLAGRASDGKLAGRASDGSQAAIALPSLARPANKKKTKPVVADFDSLIDAFLARLHAVSVLDPACGSGNFLYVALKLLLDLEKEVITFAATHGGRPRTPGVRPTQLHGLEINTYAAELAQIVIWIGLLQWQKENGYPSKDDPVLEKVQTIENRDAILDLSDPANPKEPTWPDAEFIVGNPPFLGDKKMRAELGHEYVDALRHHYSDRIPGQSDLVCYWFEKSRGMIKSRHAKRAGLIGTQGIRGGANRTCLDRIRHDGDIFFAYADRDWILDGATVHVSMVGFDNGNEKHKQLDGKKVPEIYANLRNGRRPDLTKTRLISANEELCYLGVMKAGEFDIDETTAFRWLNSPNTHRLPNSDVLRPRLTARDLLQKAAVNWIIDFGTSMSAEDACRYELPWKFVTEKVKPKRLANRRSRLAQRWWIHGEARPGLRNALVGLNRFIVTPEVSKHRIFSWLDDVYLADHQTRAVCSSHDSMLGILQSRIHELWARAQGTQLREVESGFRYTPTTCFETFPFPKPTKKQEAAIAAAAKELDTLRSNWLNPPEWTRTEVLEFPGSVDGPWKRYVHKPNKQGIGTVKYPRLVPKGVNEAEELKKRTLTKLYNERPAWLDHAHRALDEAVFAAYGWSPNLSDDELLAKLLALNLERAAEEAKAATKAPR